jgi:hypothetical protein
MAKFHIRLKVQALELEIDGEREDIPALESAVRQQFAGIVPRAELTIDSKELSGGRPGDDIEEDGKSKGKPRKRDRSRSPEGSATPVEFRHDASKYGNPVQTWTVVEKCIWLLYVLKGITGTKEVTGPQLAATFNQYFKASGRIHPPHVTRDLARAKVQNPAPIGEDKGLVYLTDEGDKVARNLVQTVLQSS